MNITDGLLIVCKRDCETCTMLTPVYDQIGQGDLPLTIYSQDDPTFPSETAIYDSELETSFRLNIEVVPTLIRFEDGKEVSRTFSWDRSEWEAISDVKGLGDGLMAAKPGCGALNVMPGTAERLQVKFGDTGITARQISIPPLQDDIEACYERGWTDGLPVVPPTPERVLRMLQGTNRNPAEVVGVAPPNLVECTVQKIAINAVMAGCLPEYMPVVLAAVEASLKDEFCMHGLLATTWFSGPIVIVNGPIARKIGMNSEGNALGQGNRANATIGRALQLVIRNVGGGKPGGVDRACIGNPGKYTFCFAEREHDSEWQSLAEGRGIETGKSAVTLFAGDGVQGIMDQLSRNPESLAMSFAQSLRTVTHYKLFMASDAILVVSPEHSRVFFEAGWSKDRLVQEIQSKLMTPGDQIIRRSDGVAEGVPAQFESATLPKFKPGGLHIVRAGGNAGLFSAIIGGWVASGPMGSTAVTVEIKE
ncbi:MAG: thioredoxin family protein [Pseudomonadota bacterium]